MNMLVIYALSSDASYCEALLAAIDEPADRPVPCRVTADQFRALIYETSK